MTFLSRASIPPSLIALAMCDFFLLFGCFVLAAFWIDAEGAGFYLFYEGGVTQIALAVFAIQLTLYFARVYEQMRSSGRVFQQICVALGVAFLLQALLAFSGSSAETPKWIMLLGSLLILAAFPAWRLSVAAALSKAIPFRKVLFVGAPLGAFGPVDQIARVLKHRPEIGLAPVGYLGDKSGASVPFLGKMDELETVLREYAPSRIAVQREARGIPVRRLLELQRLGTRVEELSNLYESVAGRVSVIEMPPERLIYTTELDSSRAAATARDIYSILAGCLILAAASPLLALAAWSIKRASPGPVFERETRVGRGGTPFPLFRFRGAESAPWIGQLGLGSLPRLLNVVRGELALVGPAPERPEFVAALRKQIPFYGHRLSVKPGLTGWAQAHASTTEMPDSIAALEYDLYYIKHLSLGLDLYALLLVFRKWLSYRE
ncbi:MAG TPA: sugar transferase [Bryobacteraceae bacterium]|nr:sugar transferase [Bryobacteraceae bacterium]